MVILYVYRKESADLYTIKVFDYLFKSFIIIERKTIMERYRQDQFSRGPVQNSVSDASGAGGRMANNRNPGYGEDGVAGT